jgi:predicted nucleotidyltransferase
MNQKISKELDIAQAKRDFIDHHLTELKNLNKTLHLAINSIESQEIPYALIGGVAVKELGRPRVTHDIDLFIRPDDANIALETLEKNGFDIERRDPSWLYKAWKDDVLVDLIFKSSGDIYFDEEVRKHVRRIRYLDQYLNAISPEDFIVIKAAAHEENNPHHWHDALAVITQGNIDWEYLLLRAKHSPRRVLSMLLYAQSNDLAVPNSIIQKLFELIYENKSHQISEFVHPYRIESETLSLVEEKSSSPIYLKGKIMDALSLEEKINVHLSIENGTIILRGEVCHQHQILDAEKVIKKIASNYHLKNLLRVRELNPTHESEHIR